LRAICELRERWGVAEVIVWGRSMGAVTAVKLYSLLLQEQAKGRHSDMRILGLVMDSAFISLKRMVVEVGQNKLNIPEFLIKAIFLMVGSSIEERANFKMEEL
jgi:pimeloyl-ACP methyl ester carboxylesterase